MQILSIVIAGVVIVVVDVLLNLKKTKEYRELEASYNQLKKDYELLKLGISSDKEV